jgi:uncharacterized protein (TIGR02145 family)
VFRAANEIEAEADSACTSYNRNKNYILPKYDDKNNYSYYKCTEDGWTFTTEKLNQGTMIDERDGHIYKTIGIKSQMWMAENLNYADSINYPSMLGRNWCMNDADSCAMFGRYYNWSAAIDSIYWFKKGKTCGYEEDNCNLPEKVQGICPEGWHLPSADEWYVLYFSMGNNYKAMQAKGFSKWEKATDEYGFSALPAGYHDGRLNHVGNYATFWSATESMGETANSWGLDASSASINHYGANDRYRGLSIRCIKD